MNTTTTNTITTADLESKIAELKEYEALEKELENQIEALKDDIKKVMNDSGLEELRAGRYIARFTTVKSNRVDTTALKTEHPDVYTAYLKVVTTRRFSVN